MNYKTKYTANQDIRQYMEDHGVTQRMLAEHLDKSQWAINTMLKTELPQKDKEDLIWHIDAIAHKTVTEAAKETEEVQETQEAEEPAQEDVTNTTKFQIGDRVKIPAKNLTIGIVCDIWRSLAQDKMMYAVDIEGGSRGLYMENQLEPAPLPISYSFTAHIDGNVAVVCMNAKQGEKEWVYARGHAHIIHDGPVGMAQAVSYASKRMFESLDTKQGNPIYFKEGNKNG